MGKKTVLTGFLLFAILTLTLTNLSNAIENIKVEGLDPNLASLVLLLKYLFSNSAIAFAVGYLRNLLGFLENWFRARYGRAEIEYELGKLGETRMASSTSSSRNNILSRLNHFINPKTERKTINQQKLYLLNPGFSAEQRPAF